MDGQTVALDNGVLTVTAEDGTIGTYRILLQKPTIQSNALLSEIEIDGLQLQGFDSNTFVYTIDKRPYNIGFKRSINSDSVSSSVLPGNRVDEHKIESDRKYGDTKLNYACRLSILYRSPKRNRQC